LRILFLEINDRMNKWFEIKSIKAFAKCPDERNLKKSGFLIISRRLLIALSITIHYENVKRKKKKTV
jgi:hypothetical protein